MFTLSPVSRDLAWQAVLDRLITLMMMFAERSVDGHHRDDY